MKQFIKNRYNAAGIAAAPFLMVPGFAFAEGSGLGGLTDAISGFEGDAVAAAIAMALIGVTVGVIKMISRKL